MNIWVPKIKILENSDALIVPQHGVGGLFRITGRLPDGRQRVLAEWQKNLITDGGLNRWGTGTPISNCSLGSGTTPPTPLDTNLVIFQRQQNSTPYYNASVTTTAPYYQLYRADYVFNPPGVNLSIAEIGVGWGTNGSNLWSRALIKDVNGDPLILNWLANETLTVSYEARLYPWLVDVPHTTVISGTTYTGIIRPSYLGGAQYSYFYNGALTVAGDGNYSNGAVHNASIGANTSWPGGTYANGPAVAAPYVSGALKGTGTLTFGPTVGNFAGGILAMSSASNPQPYQVSFTPAIPKNNLQTLTFNLDTGVWGRQP